MAAFNVTFYEGEPVTNGFSTTTFTNFTYTGPATAAGTATITDNESGNEGLTLDDDTAGGETATATATINGNTSTDVPIDAERGWLIRDNVTNETFNVVLLEVEGGDAGGFYTLSEMPLVPGRSYRVLEYSSDPDALNGDPVFTYSEFVCFAPDTSIETPTGPVPVQSLRVGDTVLTLDNGPQPLIWTGWRDLTFGLEPHKQKPIEIKPDAFGMGRPANRLMLSPQHRILVEGAQIRDLVGTDQALGLAKGFLARDGVRLMRGKRSVRYHSLMTPQHEILFANGLPVESFYPGPNAMRLLNWIERFQILALFPKLLDLGVDAYGPSARPFLKRCEVEVLTEVVDLHPGSLHRPANPKPDVSLQS